jgi:hypothetical protein
MYLENKSFNTYMEFFGFTESKKKALFIVSPGALFLLRCAE